LYTILYDYNILTKNQPNKENTFEFTMTMHLWFYQYMG